MQTNSDRNSISLKRYEIKKGQAKLCRAVGAVFGLSFEPVWMRVCYLFYFLILMKWENQF